MRYDTKRLLHLLKKSVTNTHSNGIFNMKNPPVVPTGGLKMAKHSLQLEKAILKDLLTDQKTLIKIKELEC